MSSELYSSDGLVERGSIPLDIDNVHMLLQVEQEQIQKRTFTNWVNAQLAKRRPPCMVLDLFNDFRDGSKLLDLLEVMSGQRFSRERGRGMFQHRSNIEKALSFLQKKSIKLVNINIPDIIDGKPSIILGLIWTIILQYHIEELASCLSFDSRQSSMESLASLDTRSTLSSRSASSSPVPPKGSPLHNRFRVSAKKALLLWVREQCHKAGCSINVKEFKASWRSGVVFLAILHALRPDLVDLSRARTRSNKQNLEEAFRIAEKELRIPRLLEPDDVDVRDPDEKSIMTYVAQFLQYSRDMPVPEEEMQTQYLTPPKGPSPINLPIHYTPAISASPLRQATPDRKAQEVTCWLVQAYDELLEGWHSTEGESYSERYHVFQTFLVSFNEQRRPIMPLLTAMRRTPKLSEEQRALREAWDSLSEKLREYKIELDMSLPPSLDTVARWLLRTEGALAEEQGDPQDHGCAADEAREKQELLKVCLEEMPQQLRTFQSFHNMDEYGNLMVPTDKMDELKRRFTSVRVTAKYHGIKLEYWEHRHTVLDLLGQIRAKLHIWKRPYISPEAVRLLLQEWQEMVNTQGLPSLLENALHKLKQISEKYSSKSALAADYHRVSQQVKQLEEDTARVLEEVPTAKGIMGRVMSAWDTYSDCLSSLQAWLEQGSVTHSYGSRPVVTSQSMAEWGNRHARLNEVGNFLIESTDPQTSRSVAEELRKLNVYWAEFVKRNTFESATEPSADIQTNVQDLQALIREATLILKEPLETMAGPLRTYRKRLQFIMRKIKEVDLEALGPSAECPPDQLQKLRLATPEVMQTLFEAEQVCAELQHNVSGLDSRLAELLHWETEARELYQLLRATDRKQKQPSQDPRARVIISRGLQLEGQVVTEDQDLQITVMTSQKNSPLQYLHASAMQERVRAAVVQSQEAIGMLSSLGARRDRSRSPPGAGPPSKVFIPTKAKPQHLRESDNKQPTQWPETHHRDDTFVPKIVVQEYREEKMASPLMSYTYAQAVIQTGTKSPPEYQTQVYPETTGQKQQETQEKVLMPQQQLEQQGLTTHMAIEQEKQKQQKLKHEQPLKEVQKQEMMPAQPQLHQHKQKQQVEEPHQFDVRQYHVQQHTATNIQVETQVKQIPKLHEQTLHQQTASKKKSLSSKELQSRKIQGMKNRPWLQKTASGEQKTPAPNPDQDSTQNPEQTRQIQSTLKRETERTAQVISHNTSTAGAYPKAHAKLTKQTHQQQQEPKKQKHQSQSVEQQQQLQHQQQQKEQQLEPHPVLRQVQPDSDTKNKSQTVTKTQHSTQTKVQNQSQLNTMPKPQSAVQQQLNSTSKYPSSTVGQQPATTMSLTEVSERQSHMHDFPQPHGPVKTQSLTQTQTQPQPQPQPHLQPQTCVPAGPQQSMQPQNLVHGPAISQSQTWAPVRPSSPMQAPFPGNLQPPLPSHIQLRSHPQSWAPVRPPSPKPPTNAQHETHGQSINVTQTHAQQMAESQIHPQTRVLHQTQPQQKAKPQTHALSMAHDQTDVQPIARPSQAQLPTHHQTHIQPAVHHQDHSMIDPLAQFSTLPKPLVPQLGLNSQGQLQAWTQVRASSPMSIQHLQGTAQPQPYPQGYSQSQFSSHQWTDKQEPQNQAIAQQGHHIPHPYPQQVAQPPHPQTYATAHGLSQWTQQGSQISPHGYSHISQSYSQSQMNIQAPAQSWAQTQPQINPQSPMPQMPQIRTYNTVQTDQGQVQSWVEVSPQLQSQPYQQPQSQQYLPVQHQPQPQHYPQPHLQTQTPPQSQPLHQVHHQLPSQVHLQTLQAQSHTHIQTQPVLQTMPHATTHQSQPSFLQPNQSQLLLQPKIQSPTQLKGESFTQSKPQTQLTPQTEFELSAQPNIQSPTLSKAQSMSQPKPQVQLPGQLNASSTSKSKVESQPQVKVLAQVASQPGIQSQTQPKVQLPSQPKVESITQPVPELQTIQTVVTSSTKSVVESTMKPKVQEETTPQLVAQSPIQSKDQSPTQPQAQLLPPNQLQAQSPSLPMAQTTPLSSSKSPPQARPQTFPQSQSHTQLLLQPKPQQLQTTILSQVTVLPEVQTESPDLCIKPPALAQAPAQAYTEAYNKAQALARNGFEDAKHCLQAHIMEAITVFKDKRFSSEQASVKEDTLRALDPELLEEFLRAAKGMEAFCTPSQLRDMEFFTQSFRTQWEAVRAEISGFLQQLRFEVTRRHFNTAALQCEMSLSSCSENQVQACFSADFSEAGQHLEALKELCDTLSPEDAHRLAQTQLMECEKSLAAIQRQFSGDQDTSHSDSRVHLAFSEDLTAQKEPKKPSDKPQVLAEVSQVTVQTTAEERREVEKQASVEEVSIKEALERYENCKRTLQSQIAKNEQSFKDVPSDSVSLKGLHTRLQEIQFLRQETGSMWSEYSNQCSQCSQLSGDISVEQEKTELQEQWHSQQANLQRRGSSLSAALRQIDSTENHMVDFVDHLDRYLRQPKDVTGFTLANTNILKDIKELDDNIQSELDQLVRLDPESSDLDPRECFPLTREVETHKASLDQLRQQVRKSEAAARALDRFLMSLRTVDEDISGVQDAPCSDSVVLQDCRSKLALIRQSIDSLKEKAPQLDLLLQGARLTVTRDCVPASCLDMVTALLRRLEDVDSGLASQQKGHQKETQSKSLGLRKRTLLGELKKLQDTIEKQGLKEPTMPAVQHKLRALADLEGQLQAQHSELRSLRELQEKQGGGEDLLQELEAQWNETQRAFFDRKKQGSVLLELLKKFQTCRSHLSNTIQKAEQTISDQASYMGKDNLQRSMTKVCDIKEELGSLGEQMEEMRGVCKQLQSELKKFPDYSETPFESEADTLMDNWLDITEKTDAYMDNLRVGLELWEKQLMLGGEVDSWAGAKLTLFAESHPFHNEQQVLAMTDEIHANEENISHFHKKSVEIQEMLQSQEAPLELQVMETQMRKRMEQVKELFTDCTDVFEELVAVRKHLTEKIEECQTAVENIQCCLSKIDASEPKVEVQIQDLYDDLQSQEEQSEAVLKEVGLVSSVASPLVLEELSIDCNKLKGAISRTKDLIHLKREERDRGLLKVIQDERQSFEEWFQDSQLSVNECFENPESRADVETSVKRLHSFLKSKDPERRLDQLKDQLERGSQQVPPQQYTELNTWLKEQQEEVATFRTHCQNRQNQMEALLNDLNCLQKQHDSFREWLQDKEKLSVVSENVKLLLKDLQRESGRAETLSELLASMRRQGVRADNLLKDGDNLIQRYRNLEARLQTQAEAQNAMEGEYQKFKTQAEGTSTWISDQLQPITSPGRDTEMEEIKCKALAVLNSKPMGDSKLDDLRRQMESLCEQEHLEESRKQEARLFVRDAEDQWKAALQAAEDVVHKAETQAMLDKAIDAFQTQNESFQAWIKDQNENLTSLEGHMQNEEKLQIVQAILSSRPHGELKLQGLKQQFQILCDTQGLNESRRQEIHDAVKHAEEQWRKVLQSAEEALNQAENEAASERDFNDFKNQNEAIQSWVREQKQKLLDLSSHMEFEERLQIAQAVMTSEPEGESKLLVLKRRGESLCERLEESRKLEVEQLLKYTEQQWKNVLQAARQAELRSLADDFDTQSKHTESWIRDKQQKLQSVGSHTAPEGRCHTAQTILTCRPEGDFKVNNLRRRGQSLCDHQDADEGRKVQVQQAVKDTEEQWKAVLQAAKQVEAAAEAEISQETEKRILELREFNTHQQDTNHWLGVFQQQLESLGSQSKAEDRLRTAQAIMSSKTEGDSKLQILKRQGQSLCSQDLDEHKKQEIQQKVQDTEKQWSRVLQVAKQAVGQAERQCALGGQLRDFEVLRENTRAWLEEKQQSLVSLDSQTDPEQATNTAQNILSCKPVGDSKLTELKRQSQSLSDQEDLEEHTKREAQQAVRDSEEQWKTVLQMAENTQKKAEIQYFLSKELEAFWTHGSSTKTWVEGMQKQADSMGGGTQGGKDQIEERLNTAKAILNSKSNGDTQVTELKRRAESLSEHKALEKHKKEEVKQTVRDTERQWTTVVQAAEETQRQLQGVVERLESCQYKQDQAEARLAELQKQTYNLPRVFPWPGLGERRQVVEQARALLDQSSSLAPVLSDVCAQAAELFEITRDQSWTDSSWANKESIPALLKELTDVVANVEQGILTERQCTQLIEQHQAAQDWLREQVKGLGPPPADRHGLHSAANNLKALLQTVDREQREMTELYSARDSLLSLCTPGGQDSLTLEVSHLHDLCSNSEQELKERLTTCERRLEDMDRELAKTAQALKDRAAALQWELRSLDQALSYSEPQNNIDQLQQHWHSLQNCEKSLEDLSVKVYDLHQEVKSTSSTNELPAEIVSGVQSLCQQHASLKSRLSEHQSTCCSNTASCLQDCLHTMQQWNHSNPSDSISSVQGTLEEGEMLLNSLQEALSHQQFLTACLTPDWFEKLQKESSETLREVDLHKASLKQSLKVLDERSKQVPTIQSPDVFHGNLQERKTSVVAPPRKNKRSPEKFEVKPQETMSLTDKSATIGDELPVHAEATQAEDKTQLGTEVLEVTTSTIVEQISIEPSYSISQETKPERVKPDVTAEPLLGEQMQCAVEEPTVIQKETNQSVPVAHEESLPLPSRRKSKSLATETESPTSLRNTAGSVVNEPVYVPKQQFESALKQSEVLPPRRKSKSPNLPLKCTKPQAVQMEEAPESQMFEISLTEQTEGTPVEEAKLIPIRRKSKNAEPSTASKQVVSHSTEVEPEDVKKIPESLTLSTPQVETEPTEAIVVKERKPFFTKTRSKGLKLLPEHAAGEVAETKQDPGSQKPLASSAEQTKMAADETKIIPARRKSKSLEVSTAPGSSSPMSRMPDVDPTATKQEPEKYSASPEIITGPTEMMFLPPKRKSKNTEFCQSLTAAAQMGGEPEGNKSSSDLKIQIKPYATEEIHILPARRKSKTGDLSKISETVDVPVRSPDVELEQNKIDEKSSASDVVRGPSESTNVEKGKLSPTKRKSKSLKTSDTIVKSVTDNLKESDEQKSTETTETVVLKETEVIPARRKSKRSDVSTAFKQEERNDSASKEARKEPENESVSLTEQFVTITTVSEENKLLLNTMKLTSPVASSELSYKDETRVMLKSESQIAEDVVVEISTVLEPDSALERHTDVESVKPVTVLEVVIEHAENVFVESQTIVEDTIPVDKKIAIHDGGRDPTEDLQEMNVATIILDTTEMSAQTAATHPYKAETCSSTPHAEPPESDILPNSITPTFETELQQSKHRSKEAPEQTIYQSAERDTTDTPNIADYISKDPPDM
ncbi:uncharacterized protein LOC142402517 [Odontesthes bonariensis]|uniref:uncharacterized protein LOC142402517 n=1 Tax=Odontesthes bonariensis TaxID=219752 RepID=UPI003F585E6A